MVDPSVTDSLRNGNGNGNFTVTTHELSFVDSHNSAVAKMIEHVAEVRGRKSIHFEPEVLAVCVGSIRYKVKSHPVSLMGLQIVRAGEFGIIAVVHCVFDDYRLLPGQQVTSSETKQLRTK